MKVAFFFFCLILLYSCNSTPKNSAKNALEEVKIAPTTAEIIEDSLPTDFEIIEEEEKELTLFQKAVQKQENENVFPQGVVLFPNEDVLTIEGLVFTSILQTNSNWFLCKYTRWEGETEDVFFFTFDYEGNQLDAMKVFTLAIDLNGEVNFISENEFEIKTQIDEVELDENDNLIVLSSTKNIERYTISAEGIFEKKPE